MGNENWPELVALISIFPVELPGIEPADLPGNMRPDLPVRSVSLRFSTCHYLRIRFRVLTASRAVGWIWRGLEVTYALAVIAMFAVSAVYHRADWRSATTRK